MTALPQVRLRFSQLLDHNGLNYKFLISIRIEYPPRCPRSIIDSMKSDDCAAELKGMLAELHCAQNLLLGATGDEKGKLQEKAELQDSAVKVKRAELDVVRYREVDIEWSENEVRLQRWLHRKKRSGGYSLMHDYVRRFCTIKEHLSLFGTRTIPSHETFKANPGMNSDFSFGRETY